MATEQPSYSRHTRASLSRVSKPFTPDIEDKLKTKLERQRQVTRLRIESAEKLRKILAPSEKWPTTSSVRAHRKRLAKSSGKDTVLLDQASSKPVSQPSSNASNASIVQQLQGSDQVFPFPIKTSRDLSTFPQFSSLPTELRLQIWEQAFLVPKFIELQYDTDASWPQFINYKRYGPLFSVCRESREVAQASSLHVKKMQVIKRVHYNWWNGYRHNHITTARGPALKYVSEHDTVFFRPLISSLNNSAWDLISQFRGLSQLEHIAIPLDLKMPVETHGPLNYENLFRGFNHLKTLTFMLGCTEKSWSGDASIELRDLEQWFVDGRNRKITTERGVSVDVSELARLLGTQISVRVVAWKRKL
ncbi:hypothetical protein EG329_010623 [Mollisiaceae sp. DMI_Dod_QoI]|nr:hypothetical protein EG329_010623 [Helotiales sp. DMI_Dod_QoI]